MSSSFVDGRGSALGGLLCGWLFIGMLPVAAQLTDTDVDGIPDASDNGDLNRSTQHLLEFAPPGFQARGFYERV
jgi:hypothetical protein